MAESSAGTIKSIDGTREISVEEFDSIADEGCDEIDEFLDWSKAYRDGRTPGTARVSLDLSFELLDRLHGEADRRGLSRDDLLAEWVTTRIVSLTNAPSHQTAAE